MKNNSNNWDLRYRIMETRKPKKEYRFIEMTFGDWWSKKTIEIPENWEVSPLEKLLAIPISDGPHETPKWKKSGITFLSVDNIVDNKLDFTETRHISKEDHDRFSRKC